MRASAATAIEPVWLQNEAERECQHLRKGIIDGLTRARRLPDVREYATDDVVVTVEDPDGRKVMFGTA